MINRELEFIEQLQQNRILMQIVDEVAQINLPNWYIVAGSVFQTIWNAQANKELMEDIHDIDLVYFEPNLSADRSVSRDKALEQELSARFSYQFDVHNEAQMHLWQGRMRKPYTSTENAIERFIATVHAVGITGNSRELQVFAPFGLDDIFSKTVRPIVHEDITPEMYQAKAEKWQARFSGLTVLPWKQTQ